MASIAIGVGTFLRSGHWAVSLLQVLLASVALGISAHIKIPLPFTPVPLGTQTACVMLIGALLGSRKGALATLCYLVQGWVGLPVWAGGAVGGFAYFVGPTGGYLLGYVAQAHLVGYFIERFPNASFSKTFGLLFSSVCLQLSLGTLWLAAFVGFSQCFSLGFLPFFLGDTLKALLVACYVSRRSIRPLA